MRGIVKALFIPLLLLLLQLPLQPCHTAHAQEPQVECWAVIVGIADYGWISDLRWTDDNARDLYDILAPVWGEDHIKLLVDEEAKRASIEDAVVTWLAPLEDEDDVVFFFYSGHGDYGDDELPIDEDVGGDEYLCPWDASTVSHANDIIDDGLASWFDILESENIVIIIDSCYAGGFISDLSGSGRVVMTSSREDELSWEDRGLEHSVFGNFILEALGALETVDADGNYEVSAEEVFQYTEPLVVDFKRSQHPQIYDGYLGGLSLLVMTSFDSSDQLVPIDIDGRTYLPSELPVSFVWAPGSVHTSEVSSVVTGGDGIQYVFDSWSDGDGSLSRTFSRGGEYVANYTTQYRLTVTSDYDDPLGEGWYDAGSSATVSVTSPLGAIVRQVFTGWSGDLTGTSTEATVLMDGPKTVSANWRNDYVQLYILIGGILLLLGGVSALIIVIRRRRTPPPTRRSRQVSGGAT